MKRVVVITPYEARIPLQVTSYRAFMPRYGMLTVCDALKRAGYGVRAFCELSGSRVDWGAVREADAVCFSVMSFASHRAYEYAERARKLTKAPVVFGGSHPSVLPEDCLNHCDYVVRNEGEATIVELLRVLGEGGDPGSVEGISYRRNGEAVHTPSRKFIEGPDFVGDPACVEGYRERSTAFYVADAIRNGVPRFNIAVSQGSRGCPYNCRFCFVRPELGGVYRMRDPEIVEREIDLSLKKLKTKFLFFADNDFAYDRGHTLEILRRLEKRYRGDLEIFLFGRITMGNDGELMEAMERAGRVCMGVGVESMAAETLSFYRKPHAVEETEACLRAFEKYRVRLQLLFVFGADTDGPDCVRKGLDLALRHGVYNWGFCSLYDFPTKQKVLGIEQSLGDERFIHRDWRFYSGNFVVHYPKQFPPSYLQEEMSRAYRIFYARNPKAFYQYHPIQATYRYYIPFLREAEKGMYGKDGMLREEMLPGFLCGKERIDMKFNKSTLAAELARFYMGNITRKASWKYLMSLPR